MMQQVKIFTTYSATNLQAEINYFIHNFDCNAIVNIKYSTTLDFNNRIMYSCLISYLLK
jgi:hypothetical protein